MADQGPTRTHATDFVCFCCFVFLAFTTSLRKPFFFLQALLYIGLVPRHPMRCAKATTQTSKTDLISLVLHFSPLKHGVHLKWLSICGLFEVQEARTIRGRSAVKRGGFRDSTFYSALRYQNPSKLRYHMYFIRFQYEFLRLLSIYVHS